MFPSLFTILTGTNESLKTSIIFNEALQTCMNGGRVIFITTEERAKRRKPLETPSFNLSSPREEFNNLHFRYFSESEGTLPIFSYISKLHLLPLQPHLIIVDDLSILFPTFQDKARVLSLLESARAHATILQEWVGSSSSSRTAAAVEDEEGATEGATEGFIAAATESTQTPKTCRVLIADALNDLGEYPDLAALSPPLRSHWISRSISNQVFRLEQVKVHVDDDSHNSSSSQGTTDHIIFDVSEGRMTPRP